MKVLIIDNNDKFTYSLVDILKNAKVEISVCRNNKITAERALSFDGIMISPGPGNPKESGNLLEIIDACEGKVPILGICLGHQALAIHLGGELESKSKKSNAIQTKVKLLNELSPLFSSLPSEFLAGSYRSNVVRNNSLPQDMDVTALDRNGNIMAMENPRKSLYGIQFHPESAMTPEGSTIIENFVNICTGGRA